MGANIFFLLLANDEVDDVDEAADVAADDGVDEVVVAAIANSSLGSF